MDKAQYRISSRKKRVARIRKKIFGTAERPRLCIRRTLNHFYAQIVNDVNGTSLVQVGSTLKAVQEQRAQDKNITKSGISKIVGELVAEKALEKGISQVVFDRKGYPYHGRIKEFADAARSKGLVF